MPIVVTSRYYQNRASKDVWDVIKNIEAYPSIMSNVLDITVRYTASGTQESDWVALFDGNELRWTERNFIDDDNMTLAFEQVEGDLADWRGTVRVLPEPEVQVVYEVEFDLGVPALAELLHPLGERAIMESCEQMLGAVEHTFAAAE